MATYKEIKGLTVQSFSAEPDLVAAMEGQVWYNSSTGLGGGDLRILGSMDAWSSSTDCSIARRLRTGFGTQDAGTMAFGYGPAAGVFSCEEFNGTGWTTGGTSPTPLTANDEGSDQVGTTGSSGLSCGGYRNSPAGTLTNTNEYDGTSWSGGGAIPSPTGGGINGAGSVAAGVMGGGWPSLTTCNEYASSTWTNVNAMNTGRMYAAGCGLQSTAMAIGDLAAPSGPANTYTESYDATSWTTETGFPTASGRMGAAGNSSAALAYGGMATPPNTSTTASFTWDGSGWTTAASLGLGVYAGGHFGTSTAAVLSSGQVSGAVYQSSTQIYNNDYYFRLPGVWASTSSFNTGRQAFNGMGTATAALVGGGEPVTTQSESFDGSSWTTGPTINTGRGKMGAAGTSTAGVIYGGYISTPVGNTNATEEFNGTWSTSPGTLSQDLSQMAAFGTLTTAVSGGGYNYSASPPKARSITEEYNGTTWAVNPSPSGDLGAANYDCSGAGTQTAGLSIGGNPGTKTITEEYSGTAWTAGGTLVAGKATATAAGTQTDAVVSGGPGTACFGYDGTAWSTRPSMVTSRSEVGGTTPAPASSTLAMGGSPGLATGEIYTGDTTTVTASTLTTS